MEVSLVRRGEATVDEGLIAGALPGRLRYIVHSTIGNAYLSTIPVHSPIRKLPQTSLL